MLYNTLNSLVETPEQEWIPKTIRVTLNTSPHALHFHNEVIVERTSDNPVGVDQDVQQTAFNKQQKKRSLAFIAY